MTGARSATPSQLLLAHASTAVVDSERGRLTPSPSFPPVAWHASAGPPAMYANCLRHLPDAGITIAELLDRARTGTNLDGMRRWRYVTFTPTPATVSAQRLTP